jgi:hypothetical protein
MRAFGASNAPGTCLWCGRALRPHTWDTATRRSRYGVAPEAPGPDWVCVRAPSARRIAQARESGESLRWFYRRDPCTWGFDGLGLFCTGGCALQFGVNMARIGQRLRPAG